MDGPTRRSASKDSNPFSALKSILTGTSSNAKLALDFKAVTVTSNLDVDDEACKSNPSSTPSTSAPKCAKGDPKALFTNGKAHSTTSDTEHRESSFLNIPTNCPDTSDRSSTERPSATPQEQFPRRCTHAWEARPFALSSIHGDPNSAETYVDDLHPEDVGVSFCIRAEADFDSPRKHDSDTKHLHGLSNVFFVPALSNGKDGLGKAKTFLRSVTGAVNTVIPQRRRFRKMTFAATSSIGIRTQFLLTSSSIFSCLFVIASLSVEPACEEHVDGWIMYTHLANSILYALTAIPSRAFFSRVNWRLGEELNLPFEVLWSHVKSPGLYCDIFSLVGLAAEVWHNIEDPNRRTPSPAQWCMVLQMLKSWRFLLPEDTSGVPERGFLQGLLKLLFYLICFAHCVACALILVGNFEVARGDASWLTSDSPYGFDMTKCYIIYEEAFYFSVIGLTSIGYGDLLVTPLEHSFNSFFLLVSQLFAAKVCADLTWLTSMYNQNAAEVHERNRSLVLALYKMGVPRVLAKRVLAFQRYETTMHADNIHHKAFHGLSSNLMQELRLCTYRKLVLQAPFLREQQSAVISFIADALYDTVYLPSDFIIRAGENGRELFFVRRGEAKVFLGPHAPVWGRSVEVATVTTGSYFGELAMLTGAPRGSYVMSTTYSICSILPYSAVESLVEQHPEAFTSLVQTMLKMYRESGAQKLKPECSWKDLSIKLVKKFNLQNDHEAFLWFKSHDETPDVEELLAKAFDKALQRLKVPILDRRIYWSELDIDASGGISFEEFQGKMYFPPAPVAIKDCGRETEPEEATMAPEISLKARMLRRQSTQRSLKSVPQRRLSGASTDSFDSGREFDGTHFEDMLQALIEQNKELSREIKKLTSSKDQELGTIQDIDSPDETEEDLGTIRDMDSPMEGEEEMLFDTVSD